MITADVETVLPRPAEIFPPAKAPKYPIVNIILPFALKVDSTRVKNFN